MCGTQVANSADENWNESQFRRTPHSLQNRAIRVLWYITYLTLFRPSPRPLHGWRRFLLRLFGAKVGAKVRTFPNIKIWAPWHLTLDENCSLGDGVDCYSVGPIHIGTNTTISQRVVLCTASHDHTQLHFPLQVNGIKIGAFCWIAAEAFVMPGIEVGEGTVVGVRSLVLKNLPPWRVAAGSPCRDLKDRGVRPDGTKPFENED